MRTICEQVNSGMQPLHTSRVLNKIKEENRVEPYSWSQYWCLRGFESLETRLEGISGDFGFGDEPSMADIFILPQMLSAKLRFGVDI